jgi:hypothetical protein
MMNCNKIKRLIDEAEQAEGLAFEATHHLNLCASCRTFANERASLRNLLSGIPRVNAPGNFDAQLKARMASAKPAYAWLNPALYFRFGAATAALCVAILALQYSGIIALTPTTASNDQATLAATTQEPRSENLIQPTQPAPQALPAPVPPAQVGSPVTLNTTPGAIRVVSYKASRVHANNKAADDFVAGMPRVIVRRDGKEVELPMQPISVGAQSQLLRKAARSSAPTVVMQSVSF